MWHGYHPNSLELLDTPAGFQNFKTVNVKIKKKYAETRLKAEQKCLTRTEIVKCK